MSRDGFEWKDAGVGAAGAYALAAIGLGLALIVRNRSDLKTPKRERREDRCAFCALRG